MGRATYKSKKNYVLSLKSRLTFINQRCPTHGPQSLLGQPAKEFLIRSSIILNYHGASKLSQSVLRSNDQPAVSKHLI